MGPCVTCTGNTLVKLSWEGGALAHRIHRRLKVRRSGFYLAWRWPALRNGAAYGTQATGFSPERGMKLHSRNRGGPVWLGWLLDGLELRLRCTEPGLMPPWAPARSLPWQPIRVDPSLQQAWVGHCAEGGGGVSPPTPRHPDHADGSPPPPPAGVPEAGVAPILPEAPGPPKPSQSPQPHPGSSVLLPPQPAL